MEGSLDHPDNYGVIPRAAEAIFEELNKEDMNYESFNVYCSYLEIYNERVRDLLRANQPKSGQPAHTLKVREHPKGGPYVQGKEPFCQF